MVQLIRIGNSQGIRIPKILIKQAQLENSELTLKLTDNGLLIMPNKLPRANWKVLLEATIQEQGQEVLDTDWLNANLVIDEQLDW